jgi:hypothetical protein
MGAFLSATQAKQVSPAQQIPHTLETALPHAYWNAEEQGALLAVAPERTLFRRVRNQPPLRIPPVPPRGYNLTNLLTLFDYKTIRARSAVAVAPTTMRVFTRPTISPEEGSYEGKQEASSALFVTFTATQWKLLGSKDGICLVDLTDKQQKLYLKLLPKIALLEPIESSVEIKNATKRPYITLTPTQIKQMRLRIARHIDIEFFYEGGERSTYDAHEDTTETYVLRDENDDDALEDERQEAKLPWRVCPKVPNRTKPSDLDYKSPRLNNEIALKNIKTVDDLIKHIARTTGVTLYADARVGPLSLYLRGESARAGDLLEALGVALLATFRKMPDGNGYLLTEDRDGLGTRSAAWEEWEDICSSFRRNRQQKREEIMRKNGFAIATDDPYNLPPSVQKKMKSDEWEYVPKEKRGIETLLLPPDLQKTVRESLQRFLQQKKEDVNEDGTESYKDVVKDRVEMTYVSRAYFIVPGIGQVRADIDDAEDTLPNTDTPPLGPPLPDRLTLPECWKNRRLYVSVETPEEIKEAIGLAKTYGFSGVYFDMLPIASRAIPFFKTVVAQGKANKMPVGAVCDVFYAIENHKNTYSIDKNIFGETGDEFSLRMQKFPEDIYPHGDSPYERDIFSPIPDNIQKMQIEMTKIVSAKELLGLSSLIIRIDLPIYSTDFYSRQVKPLYGYTLSNRLAFFKTYHVDPIDISLDNYVLGSSYFSDYDYEEIEVPNPKRDAKIDNKEQDATVSIKNMNYLNTQNLWDQFINVQRKSVEPSIFNALKTASPSLPIYYDRIRQSFWIRWETPTFKEINIQYSSGQNYDLAVARAIQKISPELWRTILLSDTTPEWINSLKNWMKTDKDIPFLQGVVLDCSHATLEDTKKVLESFQNLQSKSKSPNSPK